MYRIKFSIKTLSPIVLSSVSNSTVMTGTHTFFSGSIIRGIFASRFVELQKLHDEVHDKTFREIFFGNLKFLSANPEILNERSFVLPLSLQSGKEGTDDADKVQDLLSDERPLPGYKSFRGFGVELKRKFFKAQVNTNMFMHMSRSGEKERKAGRSIDGQIYNYEALDAEQNFCGEIIGDEKVLSRLYDELNLDNGKMFAYVGRSKFTQYGKCLVTFGKIEELPAQNFEERIFLLLDSPLIPFDDCFLNAKEILLNEVVNKLGEKFSLGKLFAGNVEIENFVVPWGMKRPRIMALAAGTVFELKTSSPLTDDEKRFLQEKIFAGFGMRTEEGFGQLRLWRTSNDFTKGTSDEVKPHKPEKFSDETITLVKKILMEQLLEQVRIYAYEDAKNLETQLKHGNFTHFFTRLNRILSAVGKKNVRENFKERLERELSFGNLEDHLRNLSMANKQKFFHVLVEQAPLPIDSRIMSNELNTTKIKTLFDELNLSNEDFSKDAIYLEYLTNYFRFARKLAAASGDDYCE